MVGLLRLAEVLERLDTAAGDGGSRSMLDSVRETVALGNARSSAGIRTVLGSELVRG